MLYVFDHIGTLVGTTGPHPPNHPDEQKVLPGVAKRIAELRAAGHQFAVVQTHGGVALGYLTYDQALALTSDAAAKAGIDPDRSAIAICPHFQPKRQFAAPSAQAEYQTDCDCRKPRPGLILQAIAAHRTTPENTVYVGDQPIDEQTAANAHVAFVYASEFFGWPSAADATVAVSMTPSAARPLATVTITKNDGQALSANLTLAHLLALLKEGHEIANQIGWRMATWLYAHYGPAANRTHLVLAEGHTARTKAACGDTPPEYDPSGWHLEPCLSNPGQHPNICKHCLAIWIRGQHRD